MSYLYRPLAKIGPTGEEGSRLGIGFALRIVLVLVREERNELLRDVAIQVRVGATHAGIRL